jgi:predicted glycoside hydrolase/deacetylase ChbG (UPF0249 family)
MGTSKSRSEEQLLAEAKKYSQAAYKRADLEHKFATQYDRIEAILGRERYHRDLHYEWTR